jgi:hypothetical protein
MFPNKFVLFWDDQPVGFTEMLHPQKVQDPNSVKFWSTREDAQQYLDSWLRFEPYHTVIIREIQFRIVDAPK